MTVLPRPVIDSFAACGCPPRTPRNGGWQRTVGEDLAGSTLGIIGLGNIGSQVARIGLAFGMKVIAWSQHLTAETAAAAGAE